MEQFTRKCILLVIGLFLITLAGMQVANSGLKRMKGYNNPTYEQIAHITETDREDVERTILGETFSIEEKQKQLEELKSFNMLESMGKGLTLLVQNVVRSITYTIVDKMKGAFH
ncbi:YqxA family protein [Bacillus sp. 3103sda1]|uniref:YqxA family protein n=1 Tax=Bacillus sp. 3103sda1 TaxID=2953808 RepID=UPI00209F2A85|nr:YqxA family protein [Bacillus sp. 3103sda1]MCP1125230.1 YqxA family protein [Bacillus sp. 3103sda1]